MGLLVIVARDRPSAYARAQHLFGKTSARIVVDRRVAERRWLQGGPEVERRRAERRAPRSVEHELTVNGWAIVRPDRDRRLAPSIVRAKIRHKLATGDLPSGHGMRTWFGAGSGARCGACDQVIESIHCAVADSAGPDVPLHPRCLTMWDAERRRD